ncbi:MAG: hypothetical protein ACR2KH_06260 [Sphingomicrobium sp.]
MAMKDNAALLTAEQDAEAAYFFIEGRAGGRGSEKRRQSARG